ncbi:MAG: ABC transporter ATP-binding protein [Myxococcota bacterium]
MSGPPQDAPLRRLLHYAAPFRRRIWLATSCSVINKAFDLAPPFLIGVALDVVVAREDSFLAQLGAPDFSAQLWIIALLTVLIWSLESLFEYFYHVLWRGLAQDLQHQLRMDGYRHLQGLELAYFEDRSTGGLMSVLNDDINQLERFLDVGANDILQVSFTALAVGTSFFVLVPELAWLAVLPIPVVVWGSFRFQRILMPRYADVRERVGLLNGQLANSLSGIATIKSFTAEDAEGERLGGLSEAYRDSNREAIRPSAAFTPLIRMAIMFGFVAILVKGGDMVLSGGLAAGLYATMTFLTQRLLWPLTRLGQTFDLYQRAMASTRRVLDLLDTTSKLLNGERAVAPDQVRGELSMSQVGFSYAEGPQVLRGLNLEMPAGKTTAIVGPTGSGKSTVVKLLMRFYDAQEGVITLDGAPLPSLDIHGLRGAIGLVSQDVFLFHGTVRDNIAYGRPGASDDAVIAAAKSAEAHEFIEGLPLGYDTLVGERGHKLSGGQRQRVSIARAVLKDPPILVLDEATSSVDNETEAAIQRSLERLCTDRTTIVIAHRLSTVRHADRIYVLKGGELVEQGAHEALIAEDGVYARLWRVQTGLAVGV